MGKYSKPKEKKKKKKSGCLTSVIVFFLVFGLLGSCGSDDSVPEETAIHTDPAAITTVSEPETVETTTPEADTTATDTQTTETTYANIEDIALLLDVFTASAYENYTVSHDETSITINVWQDGLAAGAILASSGNQEMYDMWKDLVGNMEAMAKETKNFVETCGRPDIWVVVNLKNDQNTENTLLSLMNGVVIYDAVIGYNALEDIG